MKAENTVRAFTVEQIAAMLNLPKSTLYDLVRRGDIAAVKYGVGSRRRIRIEAEELEEFLARSRVETGSGAGTKN